MARTQSADYDRKREIITNAATRLFAQKGFSGASLSTLADACETSKSLIYHYYSSKEAILYEVMIRHMDDLLSVCDEITARDANPEEKFRGFARVLLRHYVGAADSQKILVYEINSLPDEQRKEIVRKERTLIDYAVTLLTAARPNTGHDRKALRVKIMLFFGMLNWTHTWYRSGGPVARDAVADMASETILTSLDQSTF